MKKIIYIICSVVIFFLNMSQLNAQIDGSHLMFDMGGGVHTMLYNPNWGENKIGMGGKIGLNYAYYFHKNFGAGIGAYCNLYTSRYKLPEYELADGKKQTDESNYNYTYILYVKDHLNETQRVASVSIPISFRTQFQLGWYWDMRVNVGAAVEIPILHKYYSEGNLTTTAYYEELNVLFHDMPNHGFKKDRYNVNDEFACKKVGISPFAEIGFSRMIDNHWRFYLGVYASLSATNFIAQNENDVFYDSTSDKYPQNSFSSDLSDKMRLFKAGATLGFVYQFRSDDRGKLVQAVQFDLDTLITPEPEVVEEEEAPKVVVVPVDTTCEDVIDINYKWLADSTAKADGLKNWTPSTNSKKSQPASVKSQSSSKSNTSSNSNNASTSSATKPQTVQKQEQTSAGSVGTEPVVAKEEKSNLQIESDIPAQKIGSVTVRKKQIKARCSNGYFITLEFKDPGEVEFTPAMQSDLQNIAKYLKSNPKAKVTLENVTPNSGKSKYLIKKNMVYFSKIKNQLISYGVRPDQVVYSGN
ncbi:MAG: hypothetical protein IK017_02015 [Paludibacteraceae bacterium]|nr:hypothetical protein [Paludibacteraceae bacterium]